MTVLTGFLGAGKTTLLCRFLGTPQGQDTAVVVNEFGAAAIDDALVRVTADKTVLLGNGCLCCITRSDLQIALRRMVVERQRGEMPNFKRVVIETSGLADPSPILQTFATDRALGEAFHVELVVTVVDAETGADTLAWSPASAQPGRGDLGCSQRRSKVTGSISRDGSSTLMAMRGGCSRAPWRHLAHPPVELEAWPEEGRASRVVSITRGVAESQVRDLFKAVRGLL